MNLYQAVGLACDENASGMGVLAVFSDGIYAARDIIKTNSIKTDAFSKSESGLIGYMQDEKAYWYFSPYRKHTNRSLFTDIDHKPEKRVEIFYAHQDADGKLLQFLLDHCDGVVIAGTGAGNYSREIQDVIAAYDGDCKIVRSSRLLEGAAFASPVFDPDQKTIPAQKLPCHKARILLLLCLEKNLSYAQCVQAFEEY
jgi:L-asparaginase